MSSHRFPVSLLLSSGRFALPVASGLSCVVLAAHCRYAVGGEGIISSSLAPLVRYEERGAGWPVLAEVDSVIMSAWRVIIPPCSRRGDGSRAVCFAIGFPIAFVSFLVPCGYSFRFSSLFAPSCDTTGGEGCFAAVVLGWLVACAVACRAWGGADRFRVRMAWYHFESFSPWWCSMWIVWLGGLLAVPMVYLYCQLVVYIVRLDF